MENDLRLKEIQNFSPAFRSILAERYYHALRGVTYVPNPVLQGAMDDMSRRMLPSPEGIRELEKLYRMHKDVENW